MKEKAKRVKEWMKDHSVELVYGTYVVAIVGLTGIAIKQALNAQRAQQLAIEDAVSRGDHILPNPDGSYWILPKEMFTKDAA